MSGRGRAQWVGLTGIHLAFPDFARRGDRRPSGPVVLESQLEGAPYLRSVPSPTIRLPPRAT
jgi:hypothetical protein